MSKRTEVTARLDHALYDELRELAFKRKVTHQSVLVEGIKLWIKAQKSGNFSDAELEKAPVSVSTITVSKSGPGELLETILNSGNAVAVEAITHNLHAFVQLVSLQKKEGGAVGDAEQGGPISDDELESLESETAAIEKAIDEIAPKLPASSKRASGQ